MHLNVKRSARIRIHIRKWKERIAMDGPSFLPKENAFWKLKTDLSKCISKRIMKLFLDIKTVQLDKIIANIFTMIGLWILLRHYLENKLFIQNFLLNQTPFLLQLFAFFDSFHSYLSIVLNFCSFEATKLLFWHFIPKFQFSTI